jgi:ferrous iron transporter FeoB
MKLSELKTSEKASIVKVMGHGGFRKRIVEMGFVKGKIVESVLNAPLDDPIKYNILGYEVSLRRSEAALIEVVSEDEAKQLMPTTDNKPEVISNEAIRRVALSRRKQITVALVGNPNCGKTTLFNLASGHHEHVGNYAGVTVDAKEGRFKFEGYDFVFIDLPGTYSLSPYSPEEKYVRDYLWKETPDVVLNVVDSSNLERNLYLTTQLIDMNLPAVVALNMYDELEQRGDKLDYEMLGKLLGIPFVPTVARKKIGFDALFKTIIEMYESTDATDAEGKLLTSVTNDKLVDDYLHENKIEHRHNTKFHPSDLGGNMKIHEFTRHIHVNHGTELEKSIYRIRKLINSNEVINVDFSLRFLSIKMLERDVEIEAVIRDLPNADEIIKVRDEELKRIQMLLDETGESAIADAKYGFINGALQEAFVPSKNKDKNIITSRIDALVTNKYLGYPIFLLFMFLMFQCTFSLGQFPMDWIESGVTLLGDWLSSVMAEGPVRDLLVDGIVAGVGGVIVFLPNILILYLFISFMEDSGYMARAAFIMDKLMHKMGLHGKSFIPLIMGFGCNVPAIMATRAIEDRNSRIITILVNPLMSCSARLPVYLLLAGAFFPGRAGLVLFGMYITGIILAILLARLFKKLFFPKNDIPFVMELPPYRMPTFRSVAEHTWEKGGEYLKKMGTVILIGSIIIWFLGYYPRPNVEGELTAKQRTEQQENSYIGKIGHFIEPAIAPLGFDWKGGVALVSGFAAKEVVVSTLGVLYTGNPDEDTNSLSERLQTEVRADGKPAFTPVTAIGFMLFVLIYFPCIATVAAIKSETGSWKWALFSVAYSITLAWLIAFLTYQIFA